MTIIELSDVDTLPISIPGGGPMNETQTWTKHELVHVTCSSCGEKGYYPISREWWNEHTSPLHTFKSWFKRKLRKDQPK